MKIQMLVSAVNQEAESLAEQMKIATDAIIINQCDTNSYREFMRKGHTVRCFSMKEKGVGLSRNTALMRADGDILLFCDEDIVYETDYAAKIEAAFAGAPLADLLLFNVEVAPVRRTYWNTGKKRIHWYNYGRYPAYSIAVRRDRLHHANVFFPLLFGGGAKYSNGEDSLFLHDCLKKGLRIYAIPTVIGKETERESTWFHGYTEKFFRDRGVLYHFLYGVMAVPFALRFLLAHRAQMCGEMGFGKAFELMLDGIRSVKS